MPARRVPGDDWSRAGLNSPGDPQISVPVAVSDSPWVVTPRFSGHDAHGMLMTTRCCGVSQEKIRAATAEIWSIEPDALCALPVPNVGVREKLDETDEFAKPQEGGDSVNK
jgi:hypothetical protein